MKKKITLTVICAVLSCVCLIGTTFAWLTDQTGTVTNTFTIGDVDIDLKETTGDTYKMVPGVELPKNPTVYVNAGSEACWLFVKVTETNQPKEYLDYSIDSAWKPLTDVSGVYYIKVDADTANTGEDYPVLTDNKVTVKSELTRTDLADAEANAPTMAFIAYAIQQAGFDTKSEAENVADAWAALNS